MPLLAKMLATSLPKIINWKLAIKIPSTHILFGMDFFFLSQTPKDYKHVNQA